MWPTMWKGSVLRWLAYSLVKVSAESPAFVLVSIWKDCTHGAPLFKTTVRPTEKSVLDVRNVLGASIFPATSVVNDIHCYRSLSNFVVNARKRPVGVRVKWQSKLHNLNYYYYYYLLQLSCYPVAVVILHVYETWNWLLINLSREGYMRSM